MKRTISSRQYNKTHFLNYFGRAVAGIFFCFLAFTNIYAQDLPYVNWENNPVHALAISPDKTRLAVAHTADNRVQLFDVSLGYPVKMGHVKVGIDPVSVRFRDNNELWVVNHISDSVTIVDYAKKTVKATLHTADEPFDVIFANNRAFVSCSQANQILVYNTQNINDLPLVIDVMAEDPRAMTVNTDGSKVYVASFESGNGTTLLAGGINESDGTLGFPNNPVNREPSPYGGQNPPPNNGNGFMPAMNPELPVPPKVSLIVRQDHHGSWLDDNGEDWTHMVSGSQAELSGRVVGWKLLDHDITIIDTTTLAVSYVSGLMNIGMSIAYNPTTASISLVGTDAINEIRYEPNLNGKFIRVNIAQVSESDLDNPVIKDLNPHLDYQGSQVAQSQRDLSLGDPRGLVWSEDGSIGYVAGMGSNNVIIIDATGNRLEQFDADEGTSALALDESHNRLYVWNHFAASLQSFDATTGQELDNIQVFNPLPQSIKDGRKFLYDTHLTSGMGQAACASCHVDARMDKLAWDLGDPSAQMKEFDQNCQTELPNVTLTECSDFHPMKGPMMTQTLQDIIGNEPFHWRGDKLGIEDFNSSFENINGDDTRLTNAEMNQFKAMLATITFPPNPFRNIDNTLPDSIDLSNHYTSGRFSPAGQPLGAGNPQNGLNLFNRGLLDNVFQCGSCHTLPTGMAVNGPLKLGAINASIGGEVMPMGPMDANHLGIVSVDGSTQKSIKTPHLRNLYDKVGFEMSRSESISGFGFLHDGAIDSVARFLSAPAFSVESDQEVADLVALMMAFSGSELDNDNIPLGAEPESSKDTHAGVGQQYTLSQATQFNADIDELVAVASSNKVDLIVNAGDGGNYLFLSTEATFISQHRQQLTSVALMSLASSASPLTYTLVPKGLGERLAFDRDGDGVFDFQEIINGSDLTNAHSRGIQAKTGLWYNPDRSGHGIDVQMLADNMFIIWYSYNDDMTPTWYFAAGRYNQNWQAELLSFSWDFNSRTASSKVVGEISMQFSDAKSAQLSWVIDDRGGSEEFVYFDVATQATIKQLSGAYFDENESGWGLTVYTQGSAQVIIVYYYDENGQPRWAFANGENELSSHFDMLSFTGFCPDCEFVPTTNEIIGSVDLQFNADRKIDFSLALDYPGNITDSWLIDNVTLIPLSDELFDPELQ